MTPYSYDNPRTSMHTRFIATTTLYTGDISSEQHPVSSSSGVSTAHYSVYSDETSGRSTDSLATSISRRSQMPPMANVSPPYILPCECAFTGCGYTFYPAEREEWIKHSISHFSPHGPPPKAVCTFCDEEQFCSPSPRSHDRHKNWRKRMLHVESHYQAFESFERSRPDFHVLKHMHKCDLISDRDFEFAAAYSELPPSHAVPDSRVPGVELPPEVEAFELHVASTKNEARLKKKQESRGHAKAPSRRRHGQTRVST